MEKTKGGIDDKGHYRCFFCDGEVVHLGSDMAIDIFPDCDEEDIVHYMTCNICGAEYEIVQHQDFYNKSVGEELKLRKQYLGRHEEEDNAD